MQEIVLFDFSHKRSICEPLVNTAYIETVDRFLPKANEPIGIDGCQGLSYPSLQIIRSY